MNKIIFKAVICLTLVTFSMDKSTGFKSEFKENSQSHTLSVNEKTESNLINQI